jgi:SNF2 family DNA or RNA helicase
MAQPKTYGEVIRSGESWFIYTDPAVMMKLKRWFPRVNPNRQGALVIRATAEVSRDIEWFLERFPMEMKEEHRATLQREAQEDKELEQDTEDILQGGSLKRELKWQVPEARPYQLLGGDLALRTGRLLIADDVGLGKTLTSLLILRDQGLLPAVIVCQTHLTHQWLEELNKFMPWLTGHIAKKGTPYALAKYHDGRRPDVLILNYAKLAGWAPALRGKVKALIFDEAQELRKEGSQKYEAAGMVADGAECVIAATATPIYNYGDEIFNIVDIYAPGKLGTREEFRREWGKQMGNHMGVKDPKALAAYLKNQSLMIQRTRKEVGRELPDALKFSHMIESDEAAFARLMEGYRGKAEVLAAAEASRQELFKLSGDFEWQLRRATGIAKAGFVAEFTKTLLESGEQVVLFGWHHAVYDIWKEALKDYNPSLYTGEESPAQKLLSKQKFIEGESRVLLMSLRAGAGLNGLQEVSHLAVFGELDWSPTLHDQCIGRLRRDGMEEPVVAYFMVSDNGSDPMISDVLNLKRTQSEPFIDPDSKLLTVKEQESGRTRRLAEEFLKK